MVKCNVHKSPYLHGFLPKGNCKQCDCQTVSFEMKKGKIKESIPGSFQKSASPVPDTCHLSRREGKRCKEESTIARAAPRQGTLS